jgi:methionyl-tRNA formyltransferase
MLRVAFAGTPEFAVPTLRALSQSPHRLVGVLTQPDRPAGRGRTLTASPVKGLALELGLPLAQPATLKGETDRADLAAWAADVLVVVAYGLILPRAALAIPRLGCINVHASLLPRWRGAAPVQRAILAGDARTGITIMQMEPGLDTGPILTLRSIELTGQETAGEVLNRLAQVGAELLTETLAALEAGTETPVKQSDTGATYASKIEKRESVIDWAQSAQHIGRQVRAFNPSPVAQTLWDGQPLRIWRARAIAPASVPTEPGRVLGLIGEQLIVQCGAGALAIEQLQPAGRRVMSALEFARGRTTTGTRLG